MKRSILCTALISLAAGTALAAPVKYTAAQDHSQVAFAVDHFGFSKTHGVFEAVKGTVTWDEQNPGKSSVEVIVDAKSIDTGHADRDKDLLGADFLDAAKYPEIRFVSTTVKKVDQKNFQVAGNITLHGQTRPATFNVTLNKAGADAFTQAPTLGFSATASLKRSEFGVAAYLPGIGDQVAFTLDMEFAAAK